jgi:hypothetical protein
MRPESAFLYTEKLDQIADEFTDLMLKLRDRMHEMPPDFLTYVRLFAMEGIGKYRYQYRIYFHQCCGRLRLRPNSILLSRRKIFNK